jgi:hypothetical protein
MGMILLALAGGLAAAPARAAQAPGSRVFAASDFARFAPRTALDMLQLVPGFLMSDAEDRRGLGQSNENVLINGRPVAGKANDARDALARITAAEVLRIEIAAGASTQTAVAGRQVANVILRDAGRTKGQFTWAPSVRLRGRDPAFTQGDASLSGSQGNLEYTLGIRNDALRTGAKGPSRILGPAGDLLETRTERFVERSDQPRVGADLKVDGPGGSTVRLRGSYQRFSYRFRERSERSGGDLADRTRFLTQRQTGRRYELGGDFEIDAGPGRLKLIGLHAAERRPVDTRVTTDFADANASVGTRFLRAGDERETVARSEYRFGTEATDWLISAERADNRLDNVSTLFELGTDGSFEQVPFPGGSGDVRERRYDGAVTMTHRASPTLVLQASLGGEISRLRLVGDFGSERRFRRPKGFASVGWQPSPGLRTSFRIERRIGQLDFYDFLASRALLDERENLSNPQLVPPKVWEVSGEINRDLADLGSTTLRVYGSRISDLVELIPLGEAGEAPGNLDRATLYGVDWKTSLLLDRLGWSQARVDSRVQLQRSSVEDPVTGRSRRISNNLIRLVDLSLRHDVPGTQWAWGAGVFHTKRAADFRTRELARFREGPIAGNLYIENKDVAGLTVRAGMSNLLARQELDRFLFLARRDGPLLNVERRRRSSGPLLSLSVRGNF